MPYVNVHVSSVDFFEELDDEDLIAELEKRGYVVAGEGRQISELDGIDRVEHLSICGLKREAQIEALRIVGESIGRSLQ